MPHEKLTNLYHALCETRFGVVPPGQHHIHDVYAFVQNSYSDLCDDSYLCSENCRSGHDRPEWQHRVRAALDYLKRTSSSVRTGDQRQYWHFGPSTVPNPMQYIANDIEPPSAERVETTTFRVLRDTTLARQIKSLHRCECQMCGLAIQLPDGSLYAEAHHIQPLGSPHDGPDIAGNIIVLCPNHHAMCDYGVIRLELDRLRMSNRHAIDTRFADYHNSIIYAPNMPR
jgi:hypothetical protein